MINLVGTNHKDERHEAKIGKYVRMAAQRQVAVFLEGLPVDKGKVMQFCEAAYGINEGLVFGYESEVANAICGILLHLGYCRAPEMKSEALIGNLQTCYDIFAVDEVRKAWNSMPKGLPLVGQINQMLSTLKGADAKQFVNVINKNHQNILQSPDWIEIYKHLYGNLVTMVPQEFRGMLDDNRVGIYLNSDQNKEQEYIVYEINGKWRNQFIVRNISNTIKSEQLTNVEVFIFIGSGHIRDLLVPLIENLGGIKIVADANELP